MNRSQRYLPVVTALAVAQPADAVAAKFISAIGMAAPKTVASKSPTYYDAKIRITCADGASDGRRAVASQCNVILFRRQSQGLHRDFQCLRCND